MSVHFVKRINSLSSIAVFWLLLKNLFLFKSYLSGSILEYPKLTGRTKSFPTRTMVVPTFTSANPYEPASFAGLEPEQELDG